MDAFEITIDQANKIIKKNEMYKNCYHNENLDIFMAKQILKLENNIDISQNEKNDLLNYLEDSRIENVDLFRFVIEKGADINSLYMDEFSHFHKDIASILVDNINKISNKNSTKLIRSFIRNEVSFNGYKALINRYLTKKFNILSADEELFRWACKNGNIHAVKFLSRRSKNINIIPLCGSVLTNSRPIELAAENSHENVVRWLVEMGADYKFYPESLLMRTIKLCEDFSRKKLEFIKYLIEIDALCHSDEETKNLLYYTGASGFIELFPYFFKNNIDLFSCNNILFDAACQYGRIEIVQYLISKKIEINKTKGLFYAVKYDITHNLGIPNISKILIDNGADVNSDNAVALKPVCEMPYHNTYPLFKFFVEDCKLDINLYAPTIIKMCTSCFIKKIDIIYYLYNKGFWYQSKDDEKKLYKYIKKIYDGTYKIRDDVSSHSEDTYERRKFFKNKRLNNSIDNNEKKTLNNSFVDNNETERDKLLNNNFVDDNETKRDELLNNSFVDDNETKRDELLNNSFVDDNKTERDELLNNNFVDDNETERDELLNNNFVDDNETERVETFNDDFVYAEKNYADYNVYDEESDDENTDFHQDSEIENFVDLFEDELLENVKFEEICYKCSDPETYIECYLVDDNNKEAYDEFVIMMKKFYSIE